jgi:hypothetical protein
MKRVLIPLASYLAVTIVVPILNGAPIDAPFIEHAALTIIITGTLSAFASPRNHTLPAAKIAAPHHSSRCDPCLRTGLESATCLPRECP